MYSVQTKIWIAADNTPISDETLKRLTVLVPPKARTLRKRCEYEILVFVTECEWDTAEDETEMKKRIWAKFRSYDDAEQYAQQLLVKQPYFHKVVLRG